MSIADMIAAQGNRGPSFLERYEQMDQFKRRREMRGMLEGGSSPMELARAGYLQQAQQLQGLEPKQQKGPDLWELALRASKGDIDKTIGRVDKWKERVGTNIEINNNIPRKQSPGEISQTAISLAESTGIPKLAELDPKATLAVATLIKQGTEGYMQRNPGMSEDEAYKLSVRDFAQSDALQTEPMFELPSWAQRAQGLVPTDTTYTPTGPASAASGTVNRQNVDSSIAVPPGKEVPLPAHIEYLKANAGSREAFDRKFWPGAAAQILGN